MHPEINAQTVEDIGKHSPFLWTALGVILSGCGILIKKIGDIIYNRWVCLVAKVDNLEKIIAELVVKHDKDITELKTEHAKNITELKAEHEKNVELKDTEFENMKMIVHDLREEVHGYRKEVREELQILHRRVDAHIEKG